MNCSGVFSVAFEFDQKRAMCAVRFCGIEHRAEREQTEVRNTAPAQIAQRFSGLRLACARRTSHHCAPLTAALVRTVLSAVPQRGHRVVTAPCVRSRRIRTPRGIANTVHSGFASSVRSRRGSFATVAAPLRDCSIAGPASGQCSAVQRGAPRSLMHLARRVGQEPPALTTTQCLHRGNSTNPHRRSAPRSQRPLLANHTRHARDANETNVRHSGLHPIRRLMTARHCDASVRSGWPQAEQSSAEQTGCTRTELAAV